MLQSEFKHKRDRYDIYNNLPHGALTFVSHTVGCSLTQVSGVLNGLRKDRYNIIPLTELIAAINIWNTRFSKNRNEIDWAKQADLHYKNLNKNISQ